MSIAHFIITTPAMLCLLTPAWSQTDGVLSVDGRRASRPAPITLGKLQSAPKIDGILSDGEWAGAAKAEINFQIEPGDNTPATERTEVFLACDREHLYIAFHAYDATPTAIRGHVVKRDGIQQEDYVELLLDTYADRQRAYRFSFNPLGIQEDGLYADLRDPDVTWDGILESKGRITADGYVVEAAIPFKTMRFRAGKGVKWGVHLQRWIARKAERDSWQPISRDSSGRLAQMGALDGLDDVYTGRALDLIPTLTGSVNSERETAPLPVGARLKTVNKLDPGLTAIYAITPNLTLSATVNPDFSQVEADVPQINVNQRFALFYPERRPFFLEGTEIFNPLLPEHFQSFYSRQIIDPDWGIKLTGKLGRNGIGFIVAADRAPGLQARPGDPNSGKTAQFTIARWTRDLLTDSAIALFITDRRFGDTANTVIGGESRLRVSKATNAGFQLIRTRTREQSGALKTGWASNARLTHFGRNWRIFANDEYVSPDYDARAGFILRTGYHQQFLEFGYEWRPQKDSGLNKWLVYAWPYVVSQRARQPDGLPEVEYIDPALELQFRRGVAVSFYRSFDRQGFAGRVLHYQFNNLHYNVGSFRQVTFSGNVRWGGGINYDPRRPIAGDSLELTQDITWRLNDRLSTQMFYLKSRLSNRQTGGRFFNQEIIRNRTAYQLTRFQALRSIVDYDTALRQFGVSFLYAWTPRPNTALYLGWNDLLHNGYDPLEERRQPSLGLLRQRRTLFFKLSWNFRI